MMKSTYSAATRSKLLSVHVTISGTYSKARALMPLSWWKSLHKRGKIDSNITYGLS